MHYRTLKELKDSSLIWVTNIPDGWDTSSFKWILKKIQDGTHGSFERISDSNYPLLSAKNVFSNGISINNNESYINKEDHESITSNGFPKRGDILLTIVGSLGRCCVYEFEEPVAFQRSVAFLRLLDEQYPYYFYYFIHSTYYQNQLVNLSKTSAQSGIYINDIGNTKILIPPLPEQRAIAAFLDRKTQAIDRLIENKEQLIERLKEKRQALITRAVTKGLDPEAPMTDSGIEWLGEIPEHWEVIKLKYGARIEAGQSPSNDTYNTEGKGTVLINGPAEYSEKDFGYSRSLKWTNKPTKIVPAKTLLFCVRGSTTGRLNIAHQDICIGRGIAGVIAKGNQEFLNNVFKALRQYIIGTAQGSTYPSVSTEDLKNYWIAIPPSEEQNKIAKYIESVSKIVTKNVSVIRKQVGKLQEYRQSLISAAVTGKIDVRDEVPDMERELDEEIPA